MRALRAAWIGLALLVFAPDGARADDYWLFESAPVRPLALSPDGTRLFALNPPDARLEIFSVHAAGLTRVASVPVGQEPVAVAALSDAEVWVVNHLSDSVSIVDVASVPPRVVRTLWVGDEPGDIVFAGTPALPGDPFPRAFISAAHRGQVHPPGPGGERYGDFDVPGVGRADIWVFNTANPGAAAGGTPETILTLFGDTPRALAASADGQKVYASVFLSGNRTTAIPLGVLAPDPNDPPGPVGPIPKPETGRIAGYDGATWADPFGNDVSSVINMNLPDRDVFEIDAAAPVPVETQSFSGVGTVLYGLAVEPASGRVWVANTEANNRERFEPEIRSEIHRSQLSAIDPSAPSVTPRLLNPHIDYEVSPSPAGTAELSLSTPLGIGFAADGTLYLTAFGSGVLAELDAAALLAGTRTPATSEQIALSGGGPAGVVVDESFARVYVYTRFDNAISIVDRALRSEVAHLPLPNPEPADVVAGRPFLYDARLTSSNGEASCAVCHVFGDMDGLAWDLGDPNGAITSNPNPFQLGFGFFFHPMKGPMTTQSLRGMPNHGPLHWRGDKTDALDPLDTNAGLLAFNGAFVGLMGRAAQLDAPDMQAFADFALLLRYPPNPIRSLDNSLSSAETAGDVVYDTPFTDSVSSCKLCHVRDFPNGNFGSAGESSDVGGEPQDFKIPHLRNLYQKVGFFGAVDGPLHPSTGPAGLDQVRGFGFAHDGSVDTMDSFLRHPNFNLPADPGDPPGDVGAVSRANLIELLLGFPTGLAPIVGQQVSYSVPEDATTGPRVDLMVARAQTLDPRPEDAGAMECELVARGVVAGAARGWLLQAGAFTPDRVGEAALTDAQLRALASAPNSELTYTCVPPGSGVRLALDRDRDGVLDGDDACPDHADPGAPDSDSDAIPDACDNCAQRANAGQEDAGGVGPGALADGIGNVCQCGDVTLDGGVDAADVTALRTALAGLGGGLGASQLELCSVIGGAGDCDLRDMVVLYRAAAGTHAPAPVPVCSAALP